MNRHNNISVVIPTRNRPSDLANCISALEQQTGLYFLLEVIIIDDHSNNSFREKYEQIFSSNGKLNLKATDLPKGHRGAVFARNLGITYAQGDIIAFLDDDCIPDPNWLATIHDYFTQYPKVSAISGWIDAVDISNQLSVFRQHFYNTRYSTLMLEKTTKTIQEKFGIRGVNGLHLTNNLSGGNSAIRFQALQSVNYFDSGFQMMHDKELSIRLLKNGYICVFAPDLKVKHVHTKSTYDTIQKSFHSGKYQYKLQIKHKGINSKGVINPLRPFKAILDSPNVFPQKKTKFFQLATIIILMEFLHQLGLGFKYQVQPGND